MAEVCYGGAALWQNCVMAELRYAIKLTCHKVNVFMNLLKIQFAIKLVCHKVGNILP